MLALEGYARSKGLPASLLHLVRLRASYLNGCAYCVDMHTKDVRAEGETEQRLYAIPVWRETPFFNPRERAVLAWTEAVTEIGRAGVSDGALRGDSRSLQRGGDHLADHGHRLDQRLEPPLHRFPRRGRQLPAGERSCPMSAI
jgi:AhpD family alkylhydroperoxidase